jgi:type VI secretion system secreted protein Hcp
MEDYRYDTASIFILYDDHGVQVNSDCQAPGREGAIEVLNSSYGLRQSVDSFTGSMRERDSMTR